jgi:hypothetical protein
MISFNSSIRSFTPARNVLPTEKISPLRFSGTSGQRKKILIADDQAECRKNLRGSLKPPKGQPLLGIDYDNDILEAATVADTLRLFHQYKDELAMVLLDYDFKDPSGRTGFDIAAEFTGQSFNDFVITSNTDQLVVPTGYRLMKKVDICWGDKWQEFVDFMRGIVGSQE